jgi:hypothetical protein
MQLSIAQRSATASAVERNWMLLAWMQAPRWPF